MGALALSGLSGLSGITGQRSTPPTATRVRQFAGCPGNQAYSAALGFRFQVLSPLVITSLGCFSNNGVLPPSNAGSIRIRLATVSNPATIIRLVEISHQSQNVLTDPINRLLLQSLSTPPVLSPDTYIIWVTGHSAVFPNYNSSFGAVVALQQNSFDGAILFGSGDYYGTSDLAPDVYVDSTRFGGPTFAAYPAQ